MLKFANLLTNQRNQLNDTFINYLSIQTEIIKQIYQSKLRAKHQF